MSMMKIEKLLSLHGFTLASLLLVATLAAKVYAGDAPLGERKEDGPIVLASKQNQGVNLQGQSSMTNTAMIPAAKMEITAKNQSMTAQPMIQPNGGPKVNLPEHSNLPNKSNFFAGSAKSFQPVKQGSNQSGSGDKKTPSGVPDWVKMKGQKEKTSTMTVNDFSREAKIKKLFDVSRGAEKNLSKGNNLSDESGWSSVADRKGIPLQDVGAKKLTVEKGAGKNQVSRQAQLSAGGSAGSGQKMSPSAKRLQKEESARRASREPAAKPQSGGFFDKAAAWLQHHVGGDTKFKQPTSQGGVGVRGNPTPDSVDTSTLPAALKNQIKDTKKTKQQIETERRRRVTLPNETKRPIERVHVKVTGKDISKKRTDGLTNPVEGRDGNALPMGPSIKDSDGYEDLPGRGRRGKKKGGGGDPSPSPE